MSTTTQDTYAPLVKDFRLKLAVLDQAIVLHNDHLLSLSLTHNGGNWAGHCQIYFKNSPSNLYVVKEDGSRIAVSAFTGIVPSLGSQTYLSAQWAFDRIGLGFNPLTAPYAPHFKLMVQLIQPTYQADGVTWDMQLIGSFNATGSSSGADFGLVETMMNNKTAGPRAWANKRMDQIVSEIALYYGLTPVVDRTRFTYESMIVVQGMSHWEFLSRAADTVLGVKNDRFKFEVDETTGTLYFISLNRETNVSRRYVVYADGRGQVLNFSPDDSALANSAANGGAGDGVFVFADGFSGDEGYYISSRASGVEKAGRESANPLESIEHAFLQEYCFRTTPCRDYVEAGIQARQQAAAAAMIQFKANLTVMGSHKLRVRDLIQVLYYDASGNQNAILTGIYTIWSVTHELGSSGWTTTYELLKSFLRNAEGDTSSTQSTDYSATRTITFSYPDELDSDDM